VFQPTETKRPNVGKVSFIVGGRIKASNDDQVIADQKRGMLLGEKIHWRVVMLDGEN